jgi:hypothetical protein
MLAKRVMCPGAHYLSMLQVDIGIKTVVTLNLLTGRILTHTWVACRWTC